MWVIMLIKTTCGDLSDHHFISFSDDGDTTQDHEVTAICYKTWAINTCNNMLKEMYIKKSGKYQKC